MKKIFLPFLCLLLSCCVLPTSLQAQTGALPLEPGMSFVSCFSGVENNSSGVSDPDGFVLAVFDPRDPACNGAPNGPDYWAAASAGGYHHPSWTAENLGEIFGVHIEEGMSTAPDIFVTSAGITRSDRPQLVTAAGGTGADVFRIDGTTGAITLLASLPSTFFTTSSVNRYTGLGNIAHNAVDNLLYVSNLDDGMIYVLNATTGATVQVYDATPTVADVDYHTPVLRTVYGIAYHSIQDQLYFSLPRALTTSSQTNSVYSIALNADGTINTGATKQLKLSRVSNFTGSPNNEVRAIISDIEFSADGTRMLIAEQSVIYSFGYTLSAHRSQTALYTGSTSWSLTRNFTIGIYQDMTNAGGGVDFGYRNHGACGTANADACDDAMVATGDALTYEPGVNGQFAAYGLQISSIDGNTTGFPANSYFIDFDNTNGISDKQTNFDVDVFGGSSCLPCSLTDAGKTLERCNSNGTTPGTTDDYIDFSLNPTGAGGIGPTYTVTADNGGTVTLDGGGAASGISYGAATAFRLQDGSADGVTTFTITVTDDTDGACSVTTTVLQAGCPTPCPDPNCGNATVIQN